MKKSGAVLLLAGALSLAAFAQSPQQPSAPAQPAQDADQQQTGAVTTIRTHVNLVNVLFTVTDKKNHLVLDLTKDDFRVFEDNKPQKISFFSRETDLPLRIGILIDTSNSIRERLRFEQEAAIDFLNTTVRPGKDMAYVVGFDVTPQLVQDYTDDVNKLADAIRNLQAGGGTGLYDAIYFASKEKMLYFPPPEPYLRRVMVIVSDGRDNQSEHSRDEALAMAERGEVTIFAISTNRSGIQSPGDNVLKYFAKETGGQAFFPFAASDVAEDFRQIAKELRSQYSLAYTSTDTTRDGAFRKIAVDATEKGYHVRAKSGYWAPSQ
jgi:VWFA-related protein